MSVDIDLEPAWTYAADPLAPKVPGIGVRFDVEHHIRYLSLGAPDIPAIKGYKAPHYILKQFPDLEPALGRILGLDREFNSPHETTKYVVFKPRQS